MDVFFLKQKDLPTNDMFYFEGLFETEETKFSTNTSINQFPLYNYPTLNNLLLGINKLSIGSSRQRTPVTDLLNLHPCLFLEFAEIDLMNRNDINNFIRKYGFLEMPIQLKKPKLVEIIDDYESGEDIPDEDKFKEIKFYGEHFEKWIAFQFILRTLIKIWRFLNNKKTNKFFKIGNSDFPINENELFNYDDGKIIFFDKINHHYLEDMNEDARDFFNLNCFFDKKVFEHINTNELCPSISLDTEYANHSQKAQDNIEISPDFFVHFAESFLKEQLNKFFLHNPPKLNLRGNMSTNKISKAFTYLTLKSTIINQFVEAVINEDTFIRCLECSKWMTIGRKKVSREKAKNYCSKACRSQAYERRKKIKSCEELHELVNNFDIKKQKSFENISNYQELLDKLAINIKNKTLLDRKSVV